MRGRVKGKGRPGRGNGETARGILLDWRKGKGGRNGERGMRQRRKRRKRK